MNRFLGAAVCTVYVLTAGTADLARGSDGPDERWFACEAPEHCAWTIGEGGWPVAVRADSVEAYRDWARTQAPFTTYFTPGDCFEREADFEAYARRSRSRVTCDDRRCTIAIEPRCNR